MSTQAVKQRRGQAQLDLGIELRDGAISATEQAHAAWVERALHAIRQITAVKYEFTTDDVWEQMLGDVPPEPRAMGAAMRLAMQQRLVLRTSNTRCSTRPCCHRRPVRVWRRA